MSEGEKNKHIFQKFYRLIISTVCGYFCLQPTSEMFVFKIEQCYCYNRHSIEIKPYMINKLYAVLYSGIACLLKCTIHISHLLRLWKPAHHTHTRNVPIPTPWQLRQFCHYIRCYNNLCFSGKAFLHILDHSCGDFCPFTPTRACEVLKSDKT